MSGSREPWASRLNGAGVEHVGAEQTNAGSLMTVFWTDEIPVGHAFHGEVRWRTAPIAAAEALPERAPDRCSVVICTRDRPAELARCLASFAAQSMQPLEIIVVDNASVTDETRRATLGAGATYIREDRPGLDYARNAGARASKGEIIAYTDDDVVLHPKWLERLVGAFDDAQISAVTGLVLPAELRTPAQVHFETFWSFGRGYDRIDFASDFFATDHRTGCPAWEVGAGASMAFRRDTLAKVGLFDERLDVGAAGCSGDSELWHRILSRGGVIRYEPTAVVFHYHRADWAGLRKQIRAYMRGHAAALLVQAELSASRGSLRRAFITLPCWYLQRALKHVTGRAKAEDALMREEWTGYLAGLLFYFRSKRAKRPPQL